MGELGAAGISAARRDLEAEALGLEAGGLDHADLGGGDVFEDEERLVAEGAILGDDVGVGEL